MFVIHKIFTPTTEFWGLYQGTNVGVAGSPKAQGQGFFEGFCNVAKVATIQKLIQSILVACPDMKVEKNQDPCTFLVTYWNLVQKSGDLNYFLFEI